MAGIRAGELDQWVALESPLRSQAGSGEEVTSWQPQGERWARVITERGGQAFEAARMSAGATIRVLLRYRPDVEAGWRLSWRGQQYEVTAVDRSERRDGKLWLTAQGRSLR